MPARQSISQALRVAPIVACLGLVGAALHVYYVTSVGFPDVVRQRFPSLSTGQIIRADLVSLGLIVVLTSLVGALFSKRYGLAGFGDAKSVCEARWFWLAVAPIIGVLSYLLFGRTLAERLPGYYPVSVAWAVARVLKGALFEEVVARFGMMTILAGVVRRVWLANMLQAAFFTGLAFVGLRFYGLEPSWTMAFVGSLAASFAISLALGAMYARFGLLAAMLFRAALGLRFVAHALLTG